MFKQFKRNQINTSQILFKSPKRNMSNNNLFEFIPPGTKKILIANTFIFGCGLMMSNREYILQFFYNKYALQHNRYQVLITSHFVKSNTFDFLIDSLFTALMGSSVESMLGYQAFMKLVGLSIVFGSILLVNTHKDNSFTKTDCIFRSLIWYFVLSNPRQEIMLFPFPIPIKAAIIGVLVFLLDYITGKWANFGGFLAAAIITKRLL
jgi:membrane associated rhomboid family serine protease